MVGLYARADAEWLPDLRSELLRFPAGAHDDVVDALGLIGQLLDYALTGSKPKKAPEQHKRDAYSDARTEDSFLTDSFLTSNAQRLCSRALCASIDYAVALLPDSVDRRWSCWLAGGGKSRNNWPMKE
jgi:hypothetical protein